MKNSQNKNTQKPFDEDAMLRMIYDRVKTQGLRSHWEKQPRESAMKKRSLLLIGFALVSVFALILFNPFVNLNKDDSKTVAAIVSVDINPSFELSVNNAGLVIKIDALNPDAESLDYIDLIGLPVEDAVDKIVERAETAGFIDIDDLEDDYVVVSTVLLKGTAAQLGDTLQTRLRDRIKLSDPLQCISLVQIKATLQEQLEAKNRNLPIGLYVLNAAIQNQNGEILSVKEFFSDEANRSAIKTRASINEVTKDKIRERVETALNQLDETGVDTSEIRTRLENAGETEMQQIQNEVQNQVNQQGNPDNGNGTQTQDGSGSETGTGTKNGQPDDSGTQSGQPSDSGTGGSGGMAH
jgi:uncharacterized membrane protein